jgi:hypothetical protein
MTVDLPPLSLKAGVSKAIHIRKLPFRTAAVLG